MSYSLVWRRDFRDLGAAVAVARRSPRVMNAVFIVIVFYLYNFRKILLIYPLI
jgi:hypothetical protein